MTDRIEQFLEDSQAFVGQEAADVPQGTDLADWLSIRRLCAALGDPNPLYKDPAAGVGTKYHSMIAPPTFVAAIRTPTAAAAYQTKDYGVTRITRRASMEWVDVIRVGDRLTSSLEVTGASSAQPMSGRPTANVDCRAVYRNSYGGLIGSASGTTALVPFRTGEAMICDREIYVYADDEIAHIQQGIEGEPPPRGRLLRYWQDAQEGEELPQLVKGPLSLSDMMAWTVAEQKTMPLGSPVYKDLKRMPGRVRTNPSTNWPYWDADQEYEDILSCRDAGFVAPFSRGMHVVCLAGQVVTSWMGDDAFLRSLDVELPNHFLYGDTMWLRGRVSDKYKERVGGKTYFAVEVRISGVNQLGETVATGSAVAYLPSPGHTVTLPIPHWDAYSEIGALYDN